MKCMQKMNNVWESTAKEGYKKILVANRATRISIFM